MQNKSLVSIIVPIYNSEKYLESLFDDLDNQKYKNYEVLLVDDGSTDSSSLICKTKCKNNNKYRYFRKDNSGVSDTRNYGIFKSCGEYICFVDSDDRLLPDYLYAFVRNIEKNTSNSIVCCNMKKFFQDDEININTNENTYSPKEYSDKKFNLLFTQYAGYIWNKIYIKNIIINNNILFDSKIAMCEDLLFNYEYLKHIENIVCLDQTNYLYRINNLSASKSFKNEKWFSIFCVYDRMIKDVQKNKEDDKFYKRLVYSYIVYLYQGMFRLNYLKSSENYKNIKNDIKNRIKKVDIWEYHFSLKSLLKIFLYKYFNYITFKMFFKKEFKI